MNRFANAPYATHPSSGAVTDNAFVMLAGNATGERFMPVQCVLHERDSIAVKT